MRFEQGGIEDLAALAEVYDAVLCHFVLQYRDDTRPATSPRSSGPPGRAGLVSVIVPNPASQVTTKLLHVGPAEALAELDRDTIRTVTFDRDVRKIGYDRGSRRSLMSLGCTVTGRYGGRIAYSTLIVDQRRPEARPGLLRRPASGSSSSCATGSRSGGRGAFWQLVASVSPTRGGGAART